MRKLGMGLLAMLLCGMALGACGGGTKTVTERIEVESSTSSGGDPISDITKFCSSLAADELEVVIAEMRIAFEEHDEGRVASLAEEMLEIAEKSPPGARCVYAEVDSTKLFFSRNPTMLTRISGLEQSHELTEADVERIEREG